MFNAIKGITIGALLVRLLVALVVGVLVAAILGLFDLTAGAAGLIGLCVGVLVFLGVFGV